MLRNLPRVSIVCSWYNRGDFVRRTVDSLLAQDYPNIEVLVVNDGSTDQRVSLELSRYNDKKLRVKEQKNQGFTPTIRAAIEEVNGDYICVMGAGDRMLSRKVSLQVDYMEAHAQVGAVGCGHTLISAKSGVNHGYIQPATRIRDRNCLKRRVPFTHGTVMYRASLLREVGSYDPFFRVAQDRDLYWRICERGEIHALDENLYEKYLFENGVSFAPEGAAFTGFFSTLARQQDRELIEYYRAHPEIVQRMLDITLPRYLGRTIRKASTMAIGREYRMAFQWARLAGVQLGVLCRQMNVWKRRETVD